MSTELTTLNDGYDATIAALLGFGRPQGSEDTLPRLQINADFVTEIEHENGEKEEVSLVAGCFKVQKDGKTVYSGKNPATFRIFMQRFDYRKFEKTKDNPNGAFTQFSILANTGEEPIDDHGGIACGKLRGKAAKGDLSPTQKQLQKDVQSYRVLFGTVTFDGVTATGEKVEIKDYPVQWRLRGTNFMPVGDVLKALEQRKVLPIFIELKLKTRREKNGQAYYYVVEFDYDINKRLKVDGGIIDVSNDFLAYIKTYNQAIREKHKAAIEARGKAAEVADEGLDDDFGTEPDADDSGTEID
jgi:hypothetical protein